MGAVNKGQASAHSEVRTYMFVLEPLQNSIQFDEDTFTALEQSNDDTFQVDLRWGPRSDGVGARVGMRNIKC